MDVGMATTADIMRLEGLIRNLEARVAALEEQQEN